MKGHVFFGDQSSFLKSSLLAGDEIVKKYIMCTALLFFVFIHISSQASAKEAETVFTDYSITLDEAVDIQVNGSTNPTTDLYKDEPAYLYAKDVEIIGPNKIMASIANIRTEASMDAPIAFQFPKEVAVEVIGVEEGDVFEGNPIWFKISHKKKTYYVHSSLVQVRQAKTTKKMKVHAGPGEDYHTFGTIKAGETFTIAQNKDGWMQVSYNKWRKPKREDVKKVLDPNAEENLYQHIRLDETIGVTAEDIDSVLEGKGILEGRGKAFIAGGEKYGINEAYLIAHSFLETGLGTSELSNGIEVGLNKKKKPTLVTEKNREKLTKIKTTYNMFGIGAADSCPLDCGAKTAYENKWFTPEKAIKEGAGWIGNDYIYNDFEQNTLYKMKWNPKMAEGYYWKQYATDIDWARKQTTRMKEIYEQLTDPEFHYDIPTYNE